MASVMQGLLPETQGVQFTARPVLRTRESIVQRSARNGRSSCLASWSADCLHVNTGMSSIEVEAQLREKVRCRYDDLKQAFQTYDVDQNLSLTKGEFRRVLENFCLPMTSNQFDAVLAKVDRNPNGTIRYCDFLDKFCGKSSSPGGTEKWMSGSHKFVHQPTTKEVNIDLVEKILRDKIAGNMKTVVKAMQLFDYNMDGKIQRHELRRVLENYCFKFTDQQYDKFWRRYDFHQTGTVNHKEFLHRLGVNVQRQSLPPQNDARGAMTWPVPSQQQQQQPNRFVDAHLRNQLWKDEQMLQSMNFDQIEIEFRKRMRGNYVNLKKAFMTFDRHLDGFISLEDLKSILSNFTIPMSDQLFGQLMDRCGIKGTGRISWEAFLEKFQEPRLLGNGQTVPIKPNHKFFPIMETQALMEADDIWHELYKHVQTHYPSFKQAFLQFDNNRDGRVTRNELRKILEKFAFRLEDDQFKHLMIRLDPHHTNSISYHKFLQLFEERETNEGHKWLKSVHRYNEKQKPAIMAWETIEAILQEKITERWKSVAEAIMYHDSKAEGYISPKSLKRIIDRQVLPVSEEHFDLMLKCCTDCPAGKVNYVEFLERLNVDVSPGDLYGLSTQIQESSENANFKRMGDLMIRQNLIDQRALERTSTMSAEEVITRLKDKMSQHSVQIRKAFLKFDKKGRGRISKRVFREVLASFGILMTDEQFDVLVSELDFHNGFMKYSDFLANFEDPRMGEEMAIIRTGNHQVNPIHGDEYGMSALEVASKLRAKLRENFADLRGAFYKFDEDHNGLLNKENFRRMLDAFMFVMTHEEYEKLCMRLGIDQKSLISYKEFLERFEVRDTAEGHKWLNSVHTYNEIYDPVPVKAEEAHEILVKKAHRQWPDLAKAFLTIDTKGNGVITKKELRDLLRRFIVPITSEEFKRLWARYDEDSKGYISHQDFLKKVGADEYAPADIGTSETIIAQSRKTLEEHNKAQQMKHEEMTLKQANLGTGMTAEWVERQIRDRIRDQYVSFYTAFRKYDTKKRGYLSINEIQKVLVDLNFYISDKEFFRLLDRVGLHTDKSRLNYEMFLRAFEDGRKSSYGDRPKDVHVEEYQNLSPQDAEMRLKEKLSSQGDVMGRAFSAFDKQQIGLIPVVDFHRILDLFCFKLTDAQWKHLKTKLNMTPDNLVDYSVFLQQYGSMDQQDPDRWMEMLKVVKPHTPQLMAIDEVQERLQEAVQAHFYTLAREFAETDYAKIGVIPTKDFRDILERNVFRLTDEQFDRLWNSLPVNEFGNLNYREFLKLYSSDYSPQPLSHPSGLPNLAPLKAEKRPQTSASSRVMSRLEMSRPATMQSRALSRMSTPLVNADLAERRLKDCIFRYWKDIQRQCRVTDKDNTGTIDSNHFRDILSQYGVDLLPDDAHRLFIKYDLKENGSFCYSDFLRHFMLTLKPRDDTNLLGRKRIHPPKITKKLGEENEPFYEAMLRLRGCVTDNWKEMRRVFRSLDRKAAGIIGALDFRKTLRQFNVNLSEDEFFHLMGYYDKNMDGLISYNDFLRAYICNS